MARKNILLIVSGGIAAYKCLELVRRLGERGHRVRTVMTAAAQEFITPLSVSALTNERVFTDLFDLNDEREIGHIRLSREADLVVVAPASADLLAKMANGLANDLASAVLLACDKPILAAPAMNPRMWANPATRRNVETLRGDGIAFVGPAHGEMAEKDEAGEGRLVEVPDLLAAIDAHFSTSGGTQRLKGRHVLITSGPTHEPVDPVRYIANRSSGKQGHAIAAAAAAAGARVTLISGPVSVPVPIGIETIHVETADEMLAAAQSALPADIAIFAAAVADWKVAEASGDKIKKKADARTPRIELIENPDILKTIAGSKKTRPELVIGFAAETANVLEHAEAKLKSKGADWIVANDVSPQTGVMGGDRNTVHVLTGSHTMSWPEMAKEEVARKLVEAIADHMDGETA